MMSLVSGTWGASPTEKTMPWRVREPKGTRTRWPGSMGEGVGNGVTEGAVAAGRDVDGDFGETAHVLSARPPREAPVMTVGGRRWASAGGVP